MEKVPDWANFWKELVELRHRPLKPGEAQEDRWGKRARAFSDGIKQRWVQPDSSRALVVSKLRERPGSTLLDIGAGTGAWAVLAAPYTSVVTAVECSPAMIVMMRENLEAAGVSNVRILQGFWPEVAVEAHDFSLCSHAMYAALDFPKFIRKMVEVTRRTCFLLIRAPKPDGLMAEFAQMVLGQPHDSPNFVIAYNILLEMGICANVLFEDRGDWKGWINNSLEEAVEEVKTRLGLKDNSAYDTIIYHRLEQELINLDGRFIWPAGIRSVLIYWDVT